MSFMVETSARHIHLTQETVEKLFGEGYQLTKRKDLSYPGQFACNERLTVVGPKREQANVSILGPVRKADQVELSATDARNLGIDAPVRESGDVKGSGEGKLIGPKGEVELSEGVIIAKRHLHVREEDAAAMGIKDKEIITVFNKVDRPDADTACRDMSADYKVKLSAKTGEGIGELLDLFAVILRNRRIYFEKIFAYRDAGRIQTIRKSGQLLSEEYQDDGIHVKAYVPVELFEELYKD